MASRATAPTAQAPPSTGGQSVLDPMNRTGLNRFHAKTILIAGMGFFTDAYDLFVIGLIAALFVFYKPFAIPGSLFSLPFGGSAGVISGIALISAAAIFGAVIGPMVFGNLGDRFGRKTVYGIEMLVLVIGALASGLAWSFASLVAFRLIVGVGVGGDYPVSAVLMSEYAGREDRGRQVGLVFCAQAVGLIVGPLVALALLGGGVGAPLTWRLLLGLGAIPAAAAAWMRRTLPEPERFTAAVAAAAAGPREPGTRLAAARGPQAGLRAFLASRRLLVLLAGTAGCWFLLDYAYYGNTISTPRIIGLIAPHATQITTIAIQLAIFTVAAVPGYVLAITRMDRIGHRRLQLIGFILMGACFAVIGLVPGMTTAVLPFLLVYGISYFFSEFGPNVTTFVLPGELFPTGVRATGHGISAGIGKFGAFIGVFLFPVLQGSLGLRGTLLLTAGVSALGALLTLVLPEPAGRSLEEIEGSHALHPEPVRADAARAA